MINVFINIDARNNLVLGDESDDRLLLLIASRFIHSHRLLENLSSDIFIY